MVLDFWIPFRGDVFKWRRTNYTEADQEHIRLKQEQKTDKIQAPVPLTVSKHREVQAVHERNPKSLKSYFFWEWFYIFSFPSSDPFSVNILFTSLP